jgi:hypothetical protein
MNQLRFLSREKLIEYLDEELRLFLNDKGIYELNQYGWLADDRPDPEYIGLAMWQIEPPPSSPTVNPNPETTVLPPASLDNIFRNGHEFEGLMKAARHSIGFTYLYHPPANPGDEDLNPCFLHHYTDAVMKLNLATDRLRELFINSFEAFSGPAIKSNDPADPLGLSDEHDLFCQPFFMVGEKLAEKPDHYRELLECFGDLVPLVEQTSSYRLDGLEQSQNICVSEEIGPTISEHSAAQQTNHTKLDGHIVTRDVSEWYKLLVKTGSQIFLAEYLLRNFDKPLPSC